jgi:hypothetical protein
MCRFVAATDVMGYTIGTLMRQTSSRLILPLHLKTKGRAHDNADIEGGEYPLFEQAANEGTLRIRQDGQPG